MAKGNMLLGYANGSVGDVTFARVKGQQTARARNRNPANPKTESQVAQRMLFAGAVAFYKQSRQDFFNFAFEDKRATESDYNAFMRYNAKRGILTTSDMNTNNQPAWGPFVMANGSLSGLTLMSAFQNNMQFRFDGFTASAAATGITTVAALSDLLVKQSAGLYQYGDILTFYGRGYAVPNAGEVDLGDFFDGSAIVGSVSELQQIVLSSSDTTLLSAKGLSVYDVASSEQLQIDFTIYRPSINGGEAPFANCAFAATVVHSRNVPGGLKTSFAEFTLGADNTALVASFKEFVSSADYKREALAYQGFNPEAVLKGGLS